MHIQAHCKLREMAGEQMIVNPGGRQAERTRIVGLNATAAALFHRFRDRDFAPDEVSAHLQEAYGIPPEQAERDARSWVRALQDAEVIVE